MRDREMGWQARVSPFTWADLLLDAAFVIFLVALSYALSPQHMMWGDELLAWALLADPSWKHAFHSWLYGADGGGVSYYIFGRLLLAMTGHSPAVMRAYSAACIGLSGVVWYRLLRWYHSRFAAAFGVGLIWLGNITFLDEALQIRFYGQFTLAFALAVYGFVWIEKRRPSGKSASVIALLSTALLVHTHMLGMFYSALLLVLIPFGRQPVREKVYQAAGMVAAWMTLLPFTQAFRSSAHMQQWIPVPTFHEVLRYYLHTPISSAGPLAFTDTLNLGLLVTAMFALRIQLRRRNTSVQDGGYRTLLLIVCVLSLCPFFIYGVSHLGKPVFAARYMMPQVMCVASLITLAVDIFLTPVRRSIRVCIATALVAGIAILSVSTVRKIRTTMFQPYSFLNPLLAMKGSEPVLLFDVPLYQQLWLYGGSRGQRFFRFATPDLLALQYSPMVMPDDVFLRTTPEFLYIEDEAARLTYRELNETFMNDPRWTVADAGAVEVKGKLAPVYRIRRR